MRSLLTFMLLAATMLPALSQAQTVNICDRTPQVRDAIMERMEADDCVAVDSARLAPREGAPRGRLFAWRPQNPPKALEC